MKSITYTVELTKPEHNATFVFMPYRKPNSVGKGHYIKVLRNGEVFEYISGEYHDLRTGRGMFDASGILF